MKEKNKCELCKKKINLFSITCKCKKILCLVCLDADKHNCTFDYKLEYKQILEQQNKKIIKEKVDKI